LGFQAVTQAVVRGVGVREILVLERDLLVGGDGLLVVGLRFGFGEYVSAFARGLEAQLVVVERLDVLLLGTLQVEFAQRNENVRRIRTYGVLAQELLVLPLQTPLLKDAVEGVLSSIEEPFIVEARGASRCRRSLLMI